MINYLKYILLLFTTLIYVNIFANDSVDYLIKFPSSVIAGETYNVNIIINYENVEGSSKFEILFPDNFKIEATNTSGANFVFENNTAKFIWVIFPKTNSVELSYTVSVPKNYTGKKNIYSKFFYLENNEIKEDNISSTINIIKNNPNYNELKTTSINLKYKVQIGAYKNQIAPNTLSKYTLDNYKIEEQKEHDFYKYYIGDFKTLEEARKIANNCKIKGAFVIVYNNNKRISIKDSKTIK